MNWQTLCFEMKLSGQILRFRTSSSLRHASEALGRPCMRRLYALTIFWSAVTCPAAGQYVSAAAISRPEAMASPRDFQPVADSIKDI